MSLFKPKDTPYWWTDVMIDGVRVRKSTKCSDPNKALAFERAMIIKANSEGTEAIKHKAPLLKDFAPDFLKWVEASNEIADETRRFYRGGWALLERTPLATMRMDKIKPIDCDETKFGVSSARPDGASAFTANHALRTLRRMFTIAEAKRKFFGKMPKIKTRKVQGRSIKMSNAEALLIASKLKEHSDPQDVLLILRSTGMRPAELYKARWEYMNWETSHYANPNGKTATAQRDVPLLDEALPILRRRWLEQDSPVSGYIFPSDSKSGHIVSVNKAFRAARKAAGLPQGKVLYTARHGRATDLAAVSTLKETMLVLGHSDSRTALQYQHPDTSDLQQRLNDARTTGRIQ
jgi:integrase